MEKGTWFQIEPIHNCVEPMNIGASQQQPHTNKQTNKRKHILLLYTENVEVYKQTYNWINIIT